MPDQRQLLLLLATWCALRSGELRKLRRGDIVFRIDPDGERSGSISITRGVAEVSSTQRAALASVLGAPGRDLLHRDQILVFSEVDIPRSWRLQVNDEMYRPRSLTQQALPRRRKTGPVDR